MFLLALAGCLDFLMIIDSHLHIWSLARGDYHWLTKDLGPLYADHSLSDIEPQFEQRGISKCLLVQAADSVAETQFLLEKAHANREYVVGVVGWINFNDGNACEQLKLLARDPLLVGIRPMLQDISPDNWVLQDKFRAIFNAMIELDLVFDALVKEEQLPVIYELACRFPKLSIVIDHCGKPEMDGASHTHWLVNLKTLAKCANVTIKLSGLPAQTANRFQADTSLFFVKQVMDLFGFKRVIWGSDWPVVKLSSDYSEWLTFCQHACSSLGLNEQQQVRIFSLNAIEVYGLDLCIEDFE